MKNWILVIVLFFSSPCFAHHFSQYYQDLKDQVIEFKQESVKKSRRYHYILVPGLFGRFSNPTENVPAQFRHETLVGLMESVLPYYYRELQEVIHEELGSTSSIFYRSWYGSLKENSIGLAAHLREITKSTGKQEFVLIGHSKGGLEIIDFALRYPHLKSKVAQVIAVQSPLMGISGIDAMAKGNLVNRGLHHLCHGVCNRFLDRADEFHPDGLKTHWRDLLGSISDSEMESLNRKIFYLGSVVKPKNQTWFTYSIYQFSRHPLDRNNDGLVNLTDQVLTLNRDDNPEPGASPLFFPSVGSFVGAIEADHCELFIGGGIGLTKEWFTPAKYWYRLRDLQFEAKYKRLQFARIFLTYFLEEVGLRSKL